MTKHATTAAQDYRIVPPPGRRPSRSGGMAQDPGDSERHGSSRIRTVLSSIGKASFFPSGLLLIPRP
jgi:hypothetical protein